VKFLALEIVAFEVLVIMVKLYCLNFRDTQIIQGHPNNSGTPKYAQSRTQETGPRPIGTRQRCIMWKHCLRNFWATVWKTLNMRNRRI